MTNSNRLARAARTRFVVYQRAPRWVVLKPSRAPAREGKCIRQQGGSSGDRVGATLRHYTIMGFIGAGSMGEVYRARDRKLRRDVALKVLQSSFAHGSSRLARFEQEARVLARLNHSNIVTIYAIEDGALVMELVDGVTLADRIARGPISPPEAIPILAQILDGLEYAHQRGVIHRDLKPANIKITGLASGLPGRVKILDFGLATTLCERLAAEISSTADTATLFSSTPGAVVGTAAYMSPEQVRGEEADPRADIWAFGVIAYEMLVAARPFRGTSRSEVVASIITAEPNWSALPPVVPANLRLLLQRCLEKDRNQRLRNIAEARILIDPGTPGQEPPGRVKRVLAALLG